MEDDKIIHVLGLSPLHCSKVLKFNLATYSVSFSIFQGNPGIFFYDQGPFYSNYLENDNLVPLQHSSPFEH